MVILDVRMPGVDGITLLQQVRADPDTAGLPVLFLTANADQMHQRLPHYAALGAQLLVKPLALDQLVDLVHATLAACASGDEHWAARHAVRSDRPAPDGRTCRHDQ